ncbi:bifunctional aspartate transaminase/aspartate 4-decarboxylase [Nocardiopsis changdeensis]|uniref:Aminotransferase n=1 Tax=Nocardiopsis changdeensis TaxID=2831969 RepID=A0ABX8BVD0_9ACTN|nr:MULTISPECIES: bifunctional aspartate transaminase/aspartate 4-decarboxylase [Nocardiopsis]QUX24323.1 bifunctional aspartate transaminase/aspartate 4-decarboxylase [Nocardiopsis changdeensis]QYX34714.1 bifunctional aspartate transaminase/aspartate 4-decarboxylase [Nocardiopsis sp. MT53]
MTHLEDDRASQRRLEGLSPFELKGHLIDLAEAEQRKTAHAMLNAGRGNPNWTAAPPREAFFLLGRFAVLESRAAWNEWPAVAGMPRREGITERFSVFLDQNAGEPGADLLRRILNRVTHDRSDAVLHELVDGIIGDNYPVPDRILPFVAKSVHEYLVHAMGGRQPEAPYDLFAVEGGTAAMCYVFDSLQVNRVLRAGDRIALMTPIFTPYLEIPHLDRYGFDVVEVSASRGTADGFHTWDYDDAELDKLADPSVRMVCLVNPSNPPSVALSERALDRIRDIVENRNPDLVIVTDDVYGTFVEGFTSLMEVCPRNTIGVYSFSKYFGATGWRLGVIALQPDNTVDAQIARMSGEDAEAHRRRYASLTLDPASMKFIDRMVADSRSVALNHTAGLSTPQQVQMALFALFALTHAPEEYHGPVNEVLRRRLAALSESLGVEFPDNPLRAGYYVELDLLYWAEQHWGSEFAAWMRENYEPVDPVLRLSEEDGVVLLNGGGFDGPAWSVRVSLANLDHDAYTRIGRALREIGEEYHRRFTSSHGA